MGLSSINPLMQKELLLYGGASGLNPSCPSYVNGYFANYNTGAMYPYGYNGTYNPTFQGYGNYNQYSYAQSPYNFGMNNSYPTANLGSSRSSYNTTQFKGITQDDINKLADYYAENNILEEGFSGALTGGLSWMAFEHAQSLVHPKNAWQGIKVTKDMFKNVPKEFASKNAFLLQDAQFAVQQAVRDTGTKGWWSKWIRRPLDKAAIEPLLEDMKNALSSGDVNKIATATERLQAARGMDGRIMGTLTGKKTVAERLASKVKNIQEGTENLVNINNSVISNKYANLIKSTFKKDFVGFMIFESIFNAGKIMTAFQKDSETGIKQTAQSVGKSAIGTAGWCLGRAAGIWLGAKAGASLGIAGGPLGATIGALIGFTAGSIGMWAGHKLGNSILGHDVADKLDAQSMAQTQEGQVKLLQFAVEKAKEGKTDAQTNQIINKVLYA